MGMLLRRSLGEFSMLALVLCSALSGADAPPVDFNRDIRSILSDKCFTCHGPDESNRKTKLRFDNEQGAKQDLGGRFAILPGDVERSEIVRRITTTNKALRMPPVYAGISLNEREVDLIRQWIQQGAKWEKHWSFIPPKHPELPAVKDQRWPRNGIDHFVLSRLEREGLPHSAEADRARLLRRVTLDLTGLPPAPAEIDAFLSDSSADAYEKVVDRLLASRRYGERMAARWLDAARYADTNGYQTDGERSMWRWRDWVIEAFNRNMPFDQFTIEQIAGDMLPNATLNQEIASGFNRNHRGNGEGGIIPEEYAVEYVVDRVETTSTVWLGLTMGCARCHDHKYDPLLQKEFYRVYAYFNNVPERGKAFKYGNSPPFIPAPTPPQQEELKKLETRLGEAEAQFTRLQPELVKAQRSWEKSRGQKDTVYWMPPEGLTAYYALDNQLEGEIPSKEKHKPAEWKDGAGEFGPGRRDMGAVFEGKRFLDAGDIANFGFYDKFTLAAWIYPTSRTGAIVTRAQDVSEGSGFGLYLNEGKVQANLVMRWLDDGARLETERALELNRWHHVMVTYDGTRLASGIRIYVDGVPEKSKVFLDDLNQDFEVKEPLRIGAGGGPENRFQGTIDDVRIYGRALRPDEAAMLADTDTIGRIAGTKRDKRTAAQSAKIGLYFLETQAPQHLQQPWREVVRLRKERQQLLDSFPTVMVMKERETPRDTFVLVRGAYDRPGEKVTPGIPAILPPLSPDWPNNRLGFARWVVDPSNPLTARVIVNRFWQMYFGIGLVQTVEDFGSQGEWPSHPELLDWLATEFIRGGWDVKALQKLIVTSATYRQSSKITPELLQKDPENRLLARGPRVRLPAEMVRDQALAMAGMLVEKIGGPSVKPYQPPGLWKELSGGQDYQPDKGEGLYRRSLYTFWKRASPPPTMLNFDAAGREACVVRGARTNTPLQALDLMNDLMFVEGSRVLAQRVMEQGGERPEERIAFAFRLATGRYPSAAETKLLLNNFHHYLDRYQTDPKAAMKLVSQGQYPRNEKLDASQFAAYTAVASLILNLDEVVTRE